MIEAHVSEGGRRKFGGRHGYGHIVSPNAPFTPSFAIHPAATREVPREADLTAFAPHVMDQDQSSSCEGHATATAVTTGCATAGTPLGFVASPDAIYKGARQLDRALSGDSKARLTDDGSDPALATQFVSKFGVCPMLTVGARYSDVDLKHVNEDLDLEALLKSSKVLIAGIHRIRTVGRGRELDIARGLSVGDPARIAIDLDTAFENYTGGVFGAPDPKDNLGGHAMVILAFRTNSDGSMEFLVRNSWGHGWGIDGNCWVSAAFIAACSVVDIVSARRVS